MHGPWRILLFACFACSGCVIIDSPTYRTEEYLVFDADLLGTWEVTDGKQTSKLLFERRKTISYRIVPVGGKVSDTADAYLVKLGNRTFLDVMITDQPTWGRIILLVERRDDGKPIALRALDVKKLIAKDSPLTHVAFPLVVDVGDTGLPFSIPIRIGTAGHHVTATTDELRKFLTEAPTDVWFPRLPYEFKKLNP